MLKKQFPQAESMFLSGDLGKLTGQIQVAELYSTTGLVDGSHASKLFLLLKTKGF